MDDKKMEIIQQLMAELEDAMHPSGDELGDRLGRPKIEMMKMQAGDPDMDGDQDMGMPGKMGGDPDDDSMGPDDDDSQMSSPDDMLKRRLMKLRG